MDVWQGMAGLCVVASRFQSHSILGVGVRGPWVWGLVMCRLLCSLGLRVTRDSSPTREVQTSALLSCAGMQPSAAAAVQPVAWCASLFHTSTAGNVAYWSLVCPPPPASAEFRIHGPKFRGLGLGPDPSPHVGGASTICAYSPAVCWRGGGGGGGKGCAGLFVVVG